MRDKLAHNLNTSISMSKTSISCVEVNTPSIFDNSIISFKDDDDLASCSLEGSIGVDNYNSLHDFFQHLSQVPLHATATPTPTPTPTLPGPGYHHLEEGHKHIHVVAQGYQTVEPQVKDVDVIVKPHSKEKQPLNPEPIHMPHHDVHDPLRGPKFRDINVEVVKGHSKGKQPLETDDQHGSSRRNSQRRNSEQKRRERINAKMTAIQFLVPNCDKGDHASILDQAIKYIKSSQLQIDMMTRSIGPSQLQYLYAPQLMMQPTMFPRFGYGPWPTNLSPSGYPFVVTPSGDDGVPKIPIPQVRIQTQTQTQTQVQTSFAPVVWPLQYLPTTITTPSTPTILFVVPPLPQFTPPNPCDESSHFQPPNSC